MILENQALIEKAREFAANVHDGQTRRGGEPYFTHLEAVANSFPQEDEFIDEVIISLLHDTLEEAEEPGYIAGRIIDEFGQKTFDRVFALTNEKGEDYLSYVLALIYECDHVCLRVKIADIRHNLSTLESNRVNKRKQYDLTLQLLETCYYNMETLKSMFDKKNN